MRDPTVGDEILYRIHPNPDPKRGIITELHLTGSIHAATVQVIDFFKRTPTGKTDRVLLSSIDAITTSSKTRSANDAYERAMRGI